MQTDIAILREKIVYCEREIKDLKKELRENGQELDSLTTSKETTLLKLEQIQRQLSSIEATVNKDAGWRGFFLDFVKAAAQIAVLVGAGKWIF
jgi:chromosome segregation ATPase